MINTSHKAHTVFVFFWFFKFFYFYMKKKKKQNWKVTKQKHVKQDKAMHKTRLTQNMKAKHTSNTKTKTQRRERERERERENKWQNHLESFSFHTLEEPFHLVNLWFGGEGEELKPFKFEKNMRNLRRSPRWAKEDGNWFWSLDMIMLLLFWMATTCSN